MIDVAIIGGGPAGIAAALRLKARGMQRVVILEREALLGGALRHETRAAFRWYAPWRTRTGEARVRHLAAAALAAGVEVMVGHTVTALRPGGGLEAIVSGGAWRTKARRVLLATGGVADEPRFIETSHLQFDLGTCSPAVDQYGRCSDPAFFVVRKLARMSEFCRQNGAETGDYIADDLSGGLPSLEGKLEVRPGRGIRFVVPQTLAHVVPLRGQLEICAAEAMKGLLRVRAGEVVLYRRWVEMWPEKRVVIALDGLKTPPDDAQLIVEIVP